MYTGTRYEIECNGIYNEGKWLSKENRISRLLFRVETKRYFCVSLQSCRQKSIVYPAKRIFITWRSATFENETRSESLLPDTWAIVETAWQLDESRISKIPFLVDGRASVNVFNFYSVAIWIVQCKTTLFEKSVHQWTLGYLRYRRSMYSKSNKSV